MMSMYTMPAHRGRGVALAILDSLIDLARSCGVGRGMAADVDDGPVHERAGSQGYDRHMHLDLTDK